MSIDRKKILKSVLISCVTILILGAVYALASFGRVTISIRGGSDASTLNIKNSSGNEVLDENNRGSSFSGLLRSGRYIVEVQDGNKITRQPLEIRGFLRSTSVIVTLDSLPGRHKLTRNIDRCIVPVGRVVYSHNCTGRGVLHKHVDMTRETFPYKESVDIGYGTVLDAKPYKGGVLLLKLALLDHSEPEVSILHIVNERILSNKLIDVSSLVDREEDYEQLVLSVDNETEYSTFTVHHPNKSTLLSFTSTGAKPELFRENNEDFIASNLSSSVSIVSGDVTLGLSYPDIDTSLGLGDNEDEGFKIRDSVAIILKGGNTKNIVRYNMPTNSDSVIRCSSRLLCLLSGTNLDTFEISEDNNVFLKDKVFGVSNISVVNHDGFIYRNKDNLFRYSEQDSSSKLIYSSHYHKLLDYGSFTGDVYVRTSIQSKNPESNTHLFLLKQGGNEKDQFIHDILPYGTDSGVPIKDMDYNDNIILISAALSSYSPYSNPPYDRSEFAQVREKILSRLIKDGISHDRFTITITP